MLQYVLLLVHGHIHPVYDLCIHFYALMVCVVQFVKNHAYSTQFSPDKWPVCV